MTANERIFAIDISGSPGFAVLDVKQLKAGAKVSLVHVDHAKTDSDSPDSQRYAYIEAKTVQLIHEYGPFDAICREHFIKGGSKRATQLVFGSWAAIDMALGRYGYAIPKENEFSPSAVKKAATGNGKADKAEVEAGVRTILKLPDDFVFRTDDESDATAIAITYLQREGTL